MKTYDRVSSLFWLFLSIFVCIESIRLGIGTLRHPDMGFMAFGVSVLLGILSLTLFLQTILKKEEAETKPFFAGKLWRRVFLVLIAILIYSKLMPVVGYLISTFLLMSFLFWLVKGQRWWWVLILSSLTSLITYYVFSVWLKCQFPEGLFGL
jgi:hypothetical protein